MNIPAKNTMPGTRFAAGKSISASVLNQMDQRSARLGDMPPGTPGTGIPIGDQSAVGAIRVYVIGRGIAVPAVLEAHNYTVTDGASEWDIEWTQLIVKVQPDLIGPQADGLPQGFVPAEIAGQGRALTEPWRAWGLLYRGPSPTGDGTSVAAVELFGLSPHRGC